MGAGDSFMTGLIDALWDAGLLGAYSLRRVQQIAALSSAHRRAAGAALPDRATRDRAAERLLAD